MADVGECIAKLVTAGQITKAIGDEALDMFKRSKAKYAPTRGPAGADAAAALELAQNLHKRSAELQNQVANAVTAWRNIERRVVDDPRNGLVAVNDLFAKAMRRGDNALNKLRREDPKHPLIEGPNMDSLRRDTAKEAHAMLGAEMERLRPGAQPREQILRTAQNFIRERKGVATGDVAAKTLSDSFGKMNEEMRNRAKSLGKIFEAREDWDNPQPWLSRRVGKFSEDEFVKDFYKHVASGGLKVWNKEENTYATADKVDGLLRKAYNDIKHNGGAETPFSPEMRTFEFQHNEAGANGLLELQAKYGVGKEIPALIASHVDHISAEIARLTILGPHPDAAFEAALRLAKEKNPGTALPKGTGWLASERSARLAYSAASGRGPPVGNEDVARFMAGVRSVIGSASLRNLLISIAPSDSAMAFQAMHYDGMSASSFFKNLFEGMTKEEARHLQIVSHSAIDWMQNSFRNYEDEINVSGLARRVPRFVVRATGADLWTRNARLSARQSYGMMLAYLRDQPWEKLNPAFRDNFLAQYGFTSAEWDKIRSVEPFGLERGGQILDYPKLAELDRPLAQRLQMAIDERAAYIAHEPDARTRGLARGGGSAGTPEGEAMLAAMQFKQFALERMTTHLMRILYDGPIENRIARGATFAIYSMLAGAISLQTYEILAGKNPRDMHSPAFWFESFAKGGAGGIYGDLLENALRGNASAIGGAASGPVGGLATDIVTTLTAIPRRGLGEPSTTANGLFGIAKRHTPETWYTKLAVDRLIYDKLQVLLDPNYRASFRRANEAATKQGRGGFWWEPGTPAPQSAPNPGTALGR